MYKSFRNKKKKKPDKIVLLGKAKLDTIQVLISKILIGWYISHDEIVSISNALREYNKMNKEIKNCITSVEYIT